MNNHKRNALRAAAVLAIAVSSPTFAAESPVPPMPDSDSLGARLLEHGLSIPTPQNPFNDLTGASCSFGQDGNTWFLYISNGNDIGKPIERRCTIPVGKRIFMPIVVWVCLPFPNETVTDAINYCLETNDASEIRRLKIDGVARDDLIVRLASTHAFPLVLPKNNVFGLPPTVAVAVHDGYYATLPELDVGHHTVRVQGATTEFGFTTDVVYRLNIVKAVKLE